MKRFWASLTLLAFGCVVASAREWFVAPDGTATGDGSKERPWSLEAALKPHPSIQPMDTVWVRKGVYNGAFVSRLKGAPAKPVVLRAYPGERVVLDGRGFSPNAVLTIEGEWAWYWGLEVTNSDPQRTVGTPGSNTPTSRGTGITQSGRGTKIINCVVHDTGVGIGSWSNASEAEIYGTVIYNNGWRAPDRPHGHSIYAQNREGRKYIRENIHFNPFSLNLSIYGSASSTLSNFTLEGNVAFNGRYLVGGDSPVMNLNLAENLLYGNVAELQYTNRKNENLALERNYFPVPVLAGMGWNKVAARGNTFLRPKSDGVFVQVTISEGNELKASVFEGNTYIASSAGQAVASVLAPGMTRAQTYSFAAWQAEGFDKEGRLEVAANGTPAEAKVFVRRNFYEPNRAHVVIYNWPKRDEVEVDISALNPRPGDRWVLRNVQNYFEEFVSGVYEGKPLRVRMTGWTAAAPVGEDKPLYPVTFPEFGVFVLTLEKGGGQKTALAADPARAGVGAPGALLRTELPGGFFQGAPVAGAAPFGEELAGIRVHVTDGEGGLWWARVVMVDREKVVWEAPAQCGLGLARVRLIREGAPEEDAGVVLIEPAAPGLFTVDGSGQGAVLGWVRYRDGTVEGLAECGAAGCRARSVDGTQAEELGLMGSGFGSARDVWVRIGGLAAEVRGVERAEYPGVEWVRVGWPSGARSGSTLVRAGVQSKEANSSFVLVR
jgi:uncharacterized protein (TIGR03437 family)